MAGQGKGKRTPTNLRILEGNPSKRPLPVDEPQPDILPNIPPPPSHLDDYAKEEWIHITVGLHGLGLLTVIDEAALGAYCSAYSKWRFAEEQLKDAPIIMTSQTGYQFQNPLIGISNKAARDMVKWASEFGMTPAARAKLGVTPRKESKSKFTGLIASNGK